MRRVHLQIDDIALCDGTSSKVAEWCGEGMTSDETWVTCQECLDELRKCRVVVDSLAWGLKRNEAKSE